MRVTLVPFYVRLLTFYMVVDIRGLQLNGKVTFCSQHKVTTWQLREISFNFLATLNP